MIVGNHPRAGYSISATCVKANAFEPSIQTKTSIYPTLLYKARLIMSLLIHSALTQGAITHGPGDWLPMTMNKQVSGRIFSSGSFCYCQKNLCTGFKGVHVTMLHFDASFPLPPLPLTKQSLLPLHLSAACKLLDLFIEQNKS